jgi:GxxExxY protein
MADDLIPVPKDVEAVGRVVVDAAFQVHSAFGPGLLESAYEFCLEHELTQRGHTIQRQLTLPITYRGLKIDSAYRVDILVDARVIVEVKAVESELPVHKAQLMTYLRLASMRLGYLINFNVPVIRLGIRRIIV